MRACSERPRAILAVIELGEPRVAQRHQLLPGDDVRFLSRRFFEGDDVGERAEFGSQLPDLGELLFVRYEDRFRFAVAEHEADLAGGQDRVKRDADGPSHHTGKVGDEPFGPVLR